MNILPAREFPGDLIGEGRGKRVFSGLDHHFNLDPSVDLGEAAHTERGLLLVLENDLRPQVRGMGRDKGLAFPAKRQGQCAGGEPDPILQGVIQIHRDSPLAV